MEIKTITNKNVISYEVVSDTSEDKKETNEKKTTKKKEEKK